MQAYGRVDHEVVADIVAQDVPILARVVDMLLADLPPGGPDAT